VTARASFPALGTTAVVATADDAAIDDARALLARRLDALDEACSRFRPDSELSRACRSAGRTVEVQPLLADAVAAALDAARETDGIVDPTLGRELRTAGYDRTFALVRTRGRWEIGPRPTRARWQEVELDRERGLLRVPPGCELDLGATAKALAADRAAHAIAASTGSGVLVALGGDVSVAGPVPAGGWCVLIADDHAEPLDGAGQRVVIGEGGLATSGTAVRRWRTTTGEAHHLIDPSTGLPAATPWRTVSVAAATCLDANVASTASIVLGGAAAAWLSERRLPARLVARDGGVVHVGGWPSESEAAA